MIEDNEQVEPDVDDSAFRQEASRRSELVLDRVIASPEIQESLGFTLPETDLRGQLQKTVQGLLSAGPALAAWRDAWLETQAAAHLDKEETAADSWAIVVCGIAGFLFALVLAVAVVALVVGYIAEAVSGTLRSWPHWGLLGLWVMPVLMIIICLPFGVLDTVLVKHTNRARRAQKQLLATEREAVARRAFDDDLYQALSARARAAINAVQGGDDDLRLLVKRWPGLNESYDDAYRIQTPAATELDAHIAEVRSGSIGLAGPRGAGKTTLMRLYCSETAGEPKNLAFMIPAPVAYVASDFIVLLFSELCRSYLALREGPGAPAEGGKPPAALWIPLVFRRRQRNRADPEPGRSLLARQARQHLTELRYMITYSATLSVSASIAMVQPAVSGGSSMAQQAMSYPELVAKFRSFLTETAQEVHAQGGRVFIGIDEIDKIGSGREAQKFVNELKVIFGIPHCFYLVSVSEDALTGYELRGLPMRDAFDSAFETKILGVGDLDFANAHDLLAKRVVGLSEPYIWLCHCLAGGLPRDLIRSCVQLIRIGRQLGPDALIDRLARAVITEELRDKANAMMRSWAGSAPNDDARELVYRIQNLAVTSIEDTRELRDLTYWAREHHSDAVTAVLGGYTYFCLTLMEVFGPAVEVRKMRARRATMETLASARRTFSGDAQLAWRKISDFRSAWGLEVMAQLQASSTHAGVPVLDASLPFVPYNHAAE